jgi:tRNA threonylcarbamoyladenosine biosynthesis protein TsaB
MRPGGAAHGGIILAIDTATTTAVVALGDAGGGLEAEDSWRAGYRHGEELLERIDALLTARSLGIDDVAGIVVGTGPGAFTGLRVGLATAKGLAHGLGRPLVGVSTGAALLAAAARAGAPEPLALLLPAGPSDRVLVHRAALALLPQGTEPHLEAGTNLVAVDLEGRAPVAAVELGARAAAGLGRSLLAIGAARIAAGDGDDLAAVVPEYVTLPRGVREQAGEVSWSRGRQ